MEVEGLPAYRFRLGVTTQMLAEILWRGADWPPQSGMYVLRDQHPDHAVKHNSVRLRLASMGSEVSAASFRSPGSNS